MRHENEIEFEDGRVFAVPSSWPARRDRRVTGIDDGDKVVGTSPGTDPAHVGRLSLCCGELLGDGDRGDFGAGAVCGSCGRYFEVSHLVEGPVVGRRRLFRTPTDVPAPVLGRNDLFPHEFAGRILRLKSVTVVPFERQPGGFLCVVVEASNPSYPVGGYNIVCSDEELSDAEIVDVPARDVDDPLTLLADLHDWALDACAQGAGRELDPDDISWTGFISTWEEAHELVPLVGRFLDQIAVQDPLRSP